MPSISNLARRAVGKKPKETQYEQWSTPSPWRNEDGVFIGHSGQAWVYRTLSLSPVKWEDNEARLGIARQLSGLLAEIGQLSKNPIGGVKQLANNREIHLVSTTWQELLTSPEGNPPALSAFQAEAYGVTVPNRALMIGCRLRSSLSGANKDASGGIYKGMLNIARRAITEDVPRLDPFLEDFQLLERIFDRFEATVPNLTECHQLESWFNQGQGADVLIDEQPDKLIVADSPPIQMAAIREFDMPKMNAPDDQWILDAVSNPGDAPHLVSIRAELEPTQVTRGRARQSQRKILANIEEEQKTGDIEKAEYTEAFQMAQEFENYIAAQKQPMLSNVSFLFAREITEEAQTYMDFLETAYGIYLTPLEHRQMLALDETLPCSNVRVNPFLQDVNVAMIANSGLQAFSALGDDKGCFVGFIDPDGAPLFLDPSASSRQNLPPAFGVFGDPGSGKSSPVDTPVLTPDGATTMGQLRPGDHTVGISGEAARVDTIHPQGVLQSYRVTLLDGRSLETSREHIWPLLSASSEIEDRWTNVKLNRIIDAGLQDDDGALRWLVPLSRPVEHTAADLPVAPYQVGAVLAAGLEAIAAVRDSMEDDQVEYLTNVDTKQELPRELLHGSIAQREELLQGVMDFGGEVTEDGFLGAYSLSQGVAADFQELVWSLGGVAFAEFSDAPPLFDLTFELPTGIEPFHGVQRGEYVATSETLNLHIAEIEPTRETEHVCITVDDDDHLYVSGDYVVTHNTFFAQNFATQCVLSGLPVFFINPKAADPLPGLVDYINDSTEASASKISMRGMEDEPGAFDPFRFANDPAYAAETASIHILSALNLPNDPLRREERLALESGLRRGAEAGATCVWEALGYIANEDHQRHLKTLIEQQMDASTLFALGVAKRARGRLNMMSDHLTLLNFDRDIGLPDKSDETQYSPSERIALSTVNLVTKAALEILISNNGGVLVLDEAWTFLGQPQALSSLNRISREGRSLNIIPVFLTQRIKDVITRDLEGFLSRVLVLKLNEADEARAAIRICGLEPTDDRLEMLRNAGPKPPKDGNPAVWAQGIFRDLAFRHAWVALGPTPEDAMKAWSTNPDDKERFLEEKQKRLEDSQLAAMAESESLTEEGLLRHAAGADTAEDETSDVPAAGGDAPDFAPPEGGGAGEPVADDSPADVPSFAPTGGQGTDDPAEGRTAPAWSAPKPAWEKFDEV